MAVVLAGCDWTEPDTCGRGTRSLVVDPSPTCLEATIDASDAIVGTNRCSDSFVVSNGSASVTVPPGGTISVPISPSAWDAGAGEATATLHAMLGAQALVITAWKCLA